jgi:hypothetical protein
MGKNIIAVVVLVVLGAGGAYAYLSLGRRASDEQSAAQANSVCAKHGMAVARCPFCDKSLLAKMGECKGHGVPEALCWKCEPTLVAAFKVEGDWCNGHGVPESMCVPCGGGANCPPGATTAPTK